MFSHVTVGVDDFDRAFAFYDALLAELGLVLKFREADVPWAGWKHPVQDHPLFIITAPFDGAGALPGNGTMTAFLAPDRATVDRWHATGLSLGAQDEGAPFPRPRYHPDYYGAYLRDLDGNKLAVACHVSIAEQD